MAEQQPTTIRRSDEHPHLRETYTLGVADDTSLNIADDVGPLATLRTFDIRNGPISAARSLLVKPTIASIWHWRPIENLPPHMSVRHVNAFIRTYMVALMLVPDTEIAADVKRKLAITMGVARAVVTELYNIEVQDLIPGEVAPAYLKAVMTATGDVRFVASVDLTAAQRLEIAKAIEFTPEEKAAISSIHMTAIGVLPVQGLSLTVCNHHYLSDVTSQSYKAFYVLERQFWIASEVKSWWDSAKTALRDALFHKVGHPVLINIKMSIAMNPDIVEKLKTAGCGAAASRLPAVEAEVKTGRSYRTLVQSVRVMFELYGGFLNYVALEEALNTVDRCPPGVADAIKPGEHPQSVPAWVKDRPTALQYLKMVTNGHIDVVAYCFGFYSALSEANQALSGNADTDTLKTSFSLAKLARQCAASYTAGREGHADYSAFKKSERAKGVFNAPAFLFVGAVPPPEGTVPQGVGVLNIPPSYEAR